MDRSRSSIAIFKFSLIPAKQVLLITLTLYFGKRLADFVKKGMVESSDKM